MKIHQVINSLFASNSWILDFEKNCWLVDCGDVRPIVEIIGKMPLVGVLLTHAHYDHIYGLNELLDLYQGIPVYTNEVGREMLLNEKMNLSRYHETPFVFEYPQNIRIINDGDEIVLNGECKLKVAATPGHNDSCLTFVSDKDIFTGDSYIPGIKVVTNLPSGRKQIAKQSVERILKLAIGKTIYPGHGDITSSLE